MCRGGEPVADVVVVGGGPAGLAAAAEAAGAGLEVVLVDAGERLGGQFWRHGSGEQGPSGGHPGPRVLGELRAALARTGVRVIGGHQVWLITRDARGFTLRLRVAHDAMAAGTDSVAARSLILCPGGYDRQLPVPGWDLPGVMTAGGVQALLKGQRTLAGRRTVVAGTGPFLLSVATGLAAAGAEVSMVCEANPPLRWLRDPAGLLREPAKAAEAGKYAWLLARHRIRYRTGVAVTAIHGDDRVRSVTVASLDRGGSPRAGAELQVDTDVVALGWGFTPALELALMVGAGTRQDTDGSLVADVDDWQRSTEPGVYLAGEATGVGGASLAVREGRLSGLAVAADRGASIDRREVRRLQAGVRRGRRFAAALHRAHPIPAGWTDWLDEETLVCRCEEVSHGELRHARCELGAQDARTLKMLARSGMGMCQGRVCGFATAWIARAGAGAPPGAQDLRPLSTRPLASPVTLAELAALDEEF